MRAFISIEFPEEIKKEISKIQNQLPEFKGKKTEFENLHLTLKFLGEVDEGKIEKIKQELSEIKTKQFDSEINSIGIFSDRIIWLGIKNCDELQKEIDERLEDLFEKEKRFMGHLTIARVKSARDKKKFREDVKKIKVPEIKFVVKNFNLKKSVLTEEKPIYENIEVYNLKI